jgi:hypothetical protein
MSRISVRGNATDEELAAVLAVVSSAEHQPLPDAYARWRAIRLAAVRPAERTAHRRD